MFASFLFKRNRLLVIALLFLFTCSVSIRFAVSYFEPGTTPDPSCSPTDPTCTVLIFPDQSSHDGEFLSTDGTTVSWASVGAALTGSGTTSRVPYWTSATNLGDEAGFEYDATTNIFKSSIISGTTEFRVGTGFFGTQDTNLLNVRLGSGSGSAITSGTNNLLLGINAGTALSTSSYNTIIGVNAGTSLTTGGGSNVFIGEEAGHDQTTGYENVFIGQGAGSNVLSGQRSIAIGTSAAINSTSADRFTAIGFGALGSQVGAADNVGIGYAAGTLATGSSNVFIGSGAGYSTTSAQSNVFLGYSAVMTDITDSNNFVGGSSYAPIYDVFIGQGDFNASASAVTYHGTGGLGSDKVGGDFVVAAGQATGNALGGSILFKTSNSGVSGSTLQSLTTKMALTPEGNFGIGTTAPEAQLQIGDTNPSDVVDWNIYLYNPSFPRIGIDAGNNNSAVEFLDSGVRKWAIGSDDGTFVIFDTPFDGPRFSITNTGNVSVGTGVADYLLDVDKTNVDTNIFALHDSDGECLHNPESGSETVTCSSDERLKTNITDANTMLPYFKDLRIRQYDVIAGGDHLTGVIAQEVQVFHPELVTEGPNGYLSVAAPNTWQLIKALQELDLKIEPLSSLDLEVSGSFASLIKTYLENAANGVETFFAHKIQTHELCLDDVCVTKDDLQKLIDEKNNIQEQQDNDEEDPELIEDSGDDTSIDPPKEYIDDPEKPPEIPEPIIDEKSIEDPDLTPENNVIDLNPL